MANGEEREEGRLRKEGLAEVTRVDGQLGSVTAHGSEKLYIVGLTAAAPVETSLWPVIEAVCVLCRRLVAG